MGELYDRLTAYGKGGAYPFHMPGHKRDGKRFCFQNPFSFDITEIDGFDDLHHPSGILRDAMERAASVYGSEKSYFLVNGSSGGILAAVSACVRQGGKLLTARNCHKSVYHGIFLRGLRPVYLCPPPVSGWGTAGAVPPSAVEAALSAEPDIEAVLITSPTYEGICSDIKEIARICHERKIPLLVDGAHGAHLAYRGEDSAFPPSALEQGADLVIESLHKTLPSLTQTAILHKRSGLIREDVLEWYLQVYQTSSPSYVLMASMDSCISYMAGPEGRADMERYERRLTELRAFAGGLVHIRLLEGEHCDISKLVLKADRMGGREFYDLLRTEYRLQPEMCTETYVILMTSPGDREEGFIRLKRALGEIDGRLGAEERRDRKNVGSWSGVPVRFPAPQAARTLSQMDGAPLEACPLSACAGKISGEFAYIYPPGIPLLAPGELVTEEILSILFRYREEGLEVRGPAEKDSLRVLAEEKPF